MTSAWCWWVGWGGSGWEAEEVGWFREVGGREEEEKESFFVTTLVARARIRSFFFSNALFFLRTPKAALSS